MRRNARRGLQSKSTRQYAREFAASERGGFTIFTTVLLVWMLILGGMAVDFTRHEILRADLQNAIDRGVLAATNLSGELTGQALKDGVTVDLTEQEVAERIVNEYVANRNIGNASTQVQVVLNASSATERAVMATANADVQTIFFRMVGLDEIGVAVGAGAEQTLPKDTEIVFVLDISGSMHLNTTFDIKDEFGNVLETVTMRKIDLLEEAATDFFAEVLSGDTEDLLLSVVPFSARVTIPSDIVHLYQGYRPHHNYHHCFDINDLDFTSTAIPMGPTNIYRQPFHYRQGTQQHTNNFYVFDCPYVGLDFNGDAVNNAFLPYTNDIDVLTSYLGGIEHEFWTQANLGTKFGVSLLDPAAAPIVEYKRALNESDPNHLSDDFEGFPNAWDDETARKILILMTDGANTRKPTVKPEFYPVNDSTSPEDAQAVADLFHSQNNHWSSGNPVRLNAPNRRVEGDTELQQICTAMKSRIVERPDPTDNGVTIFTIGFDLSNNPGALEELEDCARAFGAEPGSEVPTFYQAEGGQLNEVLQAIASEIFQLKLTN